MSKIASLKNLRALFSVKQRFAHYLPEFPGTLTLLLRYTSDAYIRIVAESIRTLNVVLWNIAGTYFDVIGNYINEINQVKLYLFSTL